MAEITPNLIGDFTSGDTLLVEVTLTVKGQPDPLTDATITLILKPVGQPEPKITISMVVMAGADADAGKTTLQALPSDTLVPPGRYRAWLIRTRGPDQRWTFHREQLQVFEGAE